MELAQEVKTLVIPGLFSRPMQQMSFCGFILVEHRYSLRDREDAMCLTNQTAGCGQLIWFESRVTHTGCFRVILISSEVRLLQAGVQPVSGSLR